jgi:cell shape-determining protein MreC
MNIQQLTDDELLSYLDLTSTDPLVRRLCEVVINQSTIRRIELEDQLSEAEEDAEYYKDLYNDSRSEIRQLYRENQLLREKLDMWNIMKDTNL